MTQHGKHQRLACGPRTSRIRLRQKGVGNSVDNAPPSERGTLVNVDRDHVVHLVNGRLSDGTPNSKSKTTRADVTRMVQAALALPKPELVLHFHGGLVKESSGREIAARLAPRYASASRYPLFFVWESGFLEAIANHLQDIKDDPLFRELVKKATRWVLEQLPGVTGLRGAGGQVDPKTLDAEYEAWFDNQRNELPTAIQPSAGATVQLRSANVPAAENELALKIRFALKNDQPFNDKMLALHTSITPEQVEKPTPAATGIGAEVSPLTKVAPEQVGELFDVTSQTKGVFTIAKVALFIARAVIAVVKRFRNGRAHGIYTTIVEETLAGAYIDKVGGIIWGQMKKDTADAFGADDTCGGRALLDEIAKQQQVTGKKFERIVLIGHSTGAIYICNFIDLAATVLPDVKFDVVFLAPAVTHTRFAETLGKHTNRIGKFRQFGMRDAVESEDVLVPVVYVRSLLYFVSGVVEFAPKNGGSTQRAVDTPLVGMERFRLDPQTFGTPRFKDIADVEKFFAAHAGGLVWSLTDDGTAGSVSKSKKHGDFDNDEPTVGSVIHLLDHGF